MAYRITSYVEDNVRSTLPKMELDAAFEAKEEIAHAIKESLQHVSLTGPSLYHGQLLTIVWFIAFDGDADYEWIWVQHHPVTGGGHPGG